MSAQPLNPDDTSMTPHIIIIIIKGQSSNIYAGIIYYYLQLLWTFFSLFNFFFFETNFCEI